MKINEFEWRYETKIQLFIIIIFNYLFLIFFKINLLLILFQVHYVI